MRAFLVLVISILILFSASGCSPRNIEMPDDFSLSFSWNTGSLPPEFRYDYVITIGPGAQGEFDYIPGYGDEDDENRWVTPLDISEADLRVLYDYFRAQGFFKEEWRTDIERVGGSTTSIILTAFGVDTRVPSISKLSDTELRKVERAQDKIRRFVPQSVWDEMEKRQEEFFAAQSD